MKISSIVVVTIVLVALIFSAEATSEPRPKHKQCKQIPRENNCRPNKRQEVWTYNFAKGRCRSVYGCYTYDQKNVFRTKSKCREVCVY